MKRFALVDCNNFYVSCERLFRPDLIGKPVMVLSNNDGCIVARSAEVKALGIKMGVPMFQVKDLIERHNIQLFSSNYTLYADMSARVMTTLESFTPNLEIYSIDEAFLDLTDIALCRSDSVAYGQTIKQTVQKHVGIPVCVGMGPTKTLAKLANFAAKKWPQTGGVVDLVDPARREKLMNIVPVGEVWGIGARTAAKLERLGIHTVRDLARQAPERIRAQFNIVIARTVMELNGIACLELEEVAPDKQQIVCSRSFSRKLTDITDLRAAVGEFASRAAQKLRCQQSVAGCVTVFIRTNAFNCHQPHDQGMASVRLVMASQDTRVIAAQAIRLLEALYKPGYGYQKAGVQLSQIQPATVPEQAELFAPPEMSASSENRALMQALDSVNRRFPGGLSIIATQIDRSWQPKAERISPCYTTSWKALARVGAH